MTVIVKLFFLLINFMTNNEYDDQYIYFILFVFNFMTNNKYN